MSTPRTGGAGRRARGGAELDTGTSRRTDEDSAPDRTPRRSRRSVLAGAVAVTVGAGLAGAGPASAQPEEYVVSGSFADEELPVGETTTLDLELNEVPPENVLGLTVEIDLADGVAELTGEVEFPEDVVAESNLDTTSPSEDASSGTVSVLAGPEMEGGDTDVPIASLEVEGVGGGETDAGLAITDFQLADDIEDPTPVEPRSTESGTLTVTGGDGLPGFGLLAGTAGVLAGADLARRRAGDDAE